MPTQAEMEEMYNLIEARCKGRFLHMVRECAKGNDQQDLYHDIMGRIWKGLFGFEGRSDLITWAYAIALNAVNDYKRDTTRRNKAMSAYAQDAQQVAQAGGRGQEEILREFEQSLSENDCSLFSLYTKQLNYQEIAEIIHLDQPSVRTKVSRIKDKFKQRYI